MYLLGNLNNNVAMMRVGVDECVQVGMVGLVFYGGLQVADVL